MSMKRTIWTWWIAALAVLPVASQTQTGIVRTLSRPDAPSQVVPGAVVRVQGEYNPVMSGEDGRFALLMPGLKNGEPYTLAGVNKGGYELREPELVGRQLPFSTSVPLEIVMVSRRQLQRDKQRIEQAARENLERHYEQQLDDLNAQLAQARLTNEQYAQQLARLEADYDRYEPLIEQMAERYARTDYAALSEDDSRIQQAIEAGELDQAQQLILAKGNPAEREKKMRRIRRLAQAQRDELAADYYHLYTIHLSRLEHDSAWYYLLRRAELDTTCVQWQLDAGLFCDKMARRYEEALALYRRALRYAVASEGPNAFHTAQAHNNIAYALTRLGRYEEALGEQKIAVDLYTRLLGRNHFRTAARYSNLGVIYYYMHRLDSAQQAFDEAEAIYTAIGTETDDPRSLACRHAELLNNQAAIDAAQGRYDTAAQRLLKAQKVVPADAGQEQVMILTSLGDVAELRGEMEDAQRFWRQALDIALTVYGDNHPITARLRKELAHPQK